MHNLVEPPSSLHGEFRHGEFRFNRIESDDPVLDIVVAIFVCGECGRLHSRRMNRDPCAAQAARSLPRGRVDQPGGAGGDRYA